MPELFEYFDEKELKLELIKKEINAYSIAKELVFNKVFELEKAIIANNKNRIFELNKDKKGNLQTGSIAHKVYLFWLLEKDLITEKEFKFMNMIYYTFSNDLFPQKKTMELIIKFITNANIAQQIVASYCGKMDSIIGRIGNG